MNTQEIRNAQIVLTMLGREDHDIMTFVIYVQFDHTSCGVGGYALDHRDKNTKENVFHVCGLEAISRILDVVGVSRWEDLPGKYVRIKDNGRGTTIDEIGNLMEEKWFNLREFFSKA